MEKKSKIHFSIRHAEQAVALGFCWIGLGVFHSLVPSAMATIPVLVMLCGIWWFWRRGIFK